MSLYSYKHAFGLDLSDLSLKIVQFNKRGKSLDLVSFGKADIPQAVVNAGSILQEQALADIIKDAVKGVKGDKLRSNLVICNLPEEKVYIRIIQMPKMNKDELENAVYWEIENHIPLKIDEVYLDWCLLEDASKNSSFYRIVIAAIPKEIVDQYQSCFNKANLKLVALEPESVALARSLIKAGSGDNTSLLIDIGATGTNFVIVSDDLVGFTTRIKVSGNDFDDAIAKALKTSTGEALKIKVDMGLAKDEKVYKALEPYVGELAEKISSSLDFYTDHVARENNLNPQISQILLSGGDALLIGLPEYLSVKLKLPVKLGNSWINIAPFINKKAQKLGLNYKNSLAYSIAFGLALREYK